ncbi:5-formyltetrahydrofolate cyclo-ligase [Steroidobacter gossypii]|uniref:5-formyltetrahydrofolate cyclo-ligase n=1 Tax=Steroidobacter gossypii TaxID=2805490 RepID=UPI002AC326BD|nr:5-formyltetrahydrofolate cyclo-ligase [Steroidobacter gossypii]
MLDRQQLRRYVRQQRRQLSSLDRADAHRQFARLLSASWLLRPGRRVAVYFAYGYEADLDAVIQLARRRRCLLYLPVITDFRRSRMRFVRYDADSVMRVNRYGIAEPDPRQAEIIPVRRLDLVLLPLVAVDERGWRLGSGAGFYDRVLHHLREGRRWRRPKLIGVSYECQRVARLQPDRWDVPLDGLLTERGLRYFARPAARDLSTD